MDLFLEKTPFSLIVMSTTYSLPFVWSIMGGSTVF